MRVNDKVPKIIDYGVLNMKFLITVFLILGIPSIIITGTPNIAVAQEKLSKNLAIDKMPAHGFIIGGNASFSGKI